MAAAAGMALATGQQIAWGIGSADAKRSRTNIGKR